MKAILCLASSKILTPHPPLRPASVYPPPWLQGEDTLAGRRGGWGSIFWKTQDTALYSTYIESSLRTPNSLPVNRNRKDNCIFCCQDGLFCFLSIDPTVEKEVMTKAGEETLEKIAQVRMICWFNCGKTIVFGTGTL
jgi:hypothetical protein